MNLFFDYFQARQAEILDSIRQIVEIESPSRDAAGSRAVVDWIIREARAISLDLEIEKTHAENLGEHLIIRAFPSAEKPALLLGHTDTVHPIGAKEKNPTRIEGDKFYGGGIFDMKSGVVLMVEILKAFSNLNLKPNRPLTILLSCDEEIGSRTGRALVEREASAAEFCWCASRRQTAKSKPDAKERECIS
jgi:glutamate carboxypeptidase